MLKIIRTNEQSKILLLKAQICEYRDNDEKAFSFYFKAYQLGAPMGTFCTGIWTMLGRGCEQNIEKGLNLAKQVLTSQNQSALTLTLAFLAHDDQEKLLSIFIKAANGRFYDSLATRELTQLYFTGKTRLNETLTYPKNESLALRYYARQVVYRSGWKPVRVIAFCLLCLPPIRRKWLKELSDLFSESKLRQHQSTIQPSQSAGEEVEYIKQQLRALGVSSEEISAL